LTTLDLVIAGSYVVGILIGSATQREKKQIKKITDIRKQRDNGQVEKVLTQLEEAVNDETVNLMPLTIEAVKAYATIGEITGTLKQVFGEYSGYGTI